jgi:hypothetical protein
MRAGGHGDSRAELTLGEPSLHDNICNTPLRLVQEGMVNVTELCSSSGGGLSTQEECAEDRLRRGGLRMAENHIGDHHHVGGPRTR